MSKTMTLAAAVAVVFVAILVLVALGASQNNNSGTLSSSSSSAFSSTSIPSATSFAMPASCHSIGGLPDPNCTPGATNPDVTQTNIQSTICVTGYTGTIRPPSSYTNNLKQQSIRLYGYNDTNMADYEEDHLIALEVGGNPTDVRNLWAQPHYGQYTAFDKDKFENYLHSQVCGGQKTLAEAQRELSTNWVQYWLASGGVASSSSTTQQTSSSTSQQTSSSAKGQIAATISFGSDPIARGSTQTITIKASDSQSPLLNTAVSVHVVYASLQTTRDLSCNTSSTGTCSVSWQIGGTSNPGTFNVSVTIDGTKFSSSFQVTA
jgi:hypothetical protein